jgi:hypothetical protein
LLASSDPITFTGFGFHTLEFNLLSHVVLDPGSQYTFRLTVLAGGGYEEHRSLLNPYAGGTAITPSGGVFAESDLVFAEGVSAPEPSSLFLLMCVGLVAVGASIRKIDFNRR